MNIPDGDASDGVADDRLTALSDLPDWFVEARRRARGRYGSIEHEGCRIAYQAWGERGAPPLLMLHGAGASSEWWDATASLLSDRYHIVAPSAAGVGRSQWRDSYTIQQWAAEAIACAEAEGVMGAGVQPTCIAHSFGSEAGVQLAIDPREVIAHLILVDSLMATYGSFDSSFPLRERQFYASQQDAVRRFSTVPRDDFGPAFLRALVARDSLERVDLPSGEAAWTWRADPNVLSKLNHTPLFPRIGEARCPVDFIFGGRSSMNSAALRDQQAEAVSADAMFLGIADAGHHILLDTPAELAAAIEQLMALRQA